MVHRSVLREGTDAALRLERDGMVHEDDPAVNGFP